MTLKIDLDLESADPEYGFCTLLTERNFWVNFILNRSKGSGDFKGTQNCWVDPMTLKCELDLKLNENRSKGSLKLFCTLLSLVDFT